MTPLQKSSHTALDLPNLPPDQLTVLRHVLRKGEIQEDELGQNLAGQFKPDQLATILASLLQMGLMTRQEQNGQISYRGQLNRRSLGTQAMKGVWDALDFDEHESTINPDMRRARSPLTDRLLANLDHSLANISVVSPQEPLAGAQSLMDDLLATGRTAMEKHTMPPQDNPQNDDNSDSLINDLVSAAKTSAKKPEVSSPTQAAPPRRLSTTDFASIPRSIEEEAAEAEAEANVAKAIPPVTIPDDVSGATVPHVAERPTDSPAPEGMVGKILRLFGLGKD